MTTRPPDVDPQLLAAARSIARRGDDAVAIQDQARTVGGCEQPVRVAGNGRRVDTATGEVLGDWSTSDMPDGTLAIRCKDRRRSRCEPCSRLYQDDAYQLTRAGLAGGKGVPDTVQAHPAVFVTLTAPSFGPVHSRRLGRDGKALPCRARRDQHDQVCAHERPVTCTRRHRDDDAALGTPICPVCFDYAGVIAWNHHAAELWRRTTIRLYRELAAHLGVTEQTVKRQVRLSYVKVAEWQRRGLIHFHATIRLDARSQEPDAHEPPPDGYTIDVLEAAVRAAVARVSVPYSSAVASLARRNRTSRTVYRTTTINHAPISTASSNSSKIEPWSSCAGVSSGGFTSSMVDRNPGTVPVHSDSVSGRVTDALNAGNTTATTTAAATATTSTRHAAATPRSDNPTDPAPRIPTASDRTAAPLGPRARGGRGSQGLASEARGCAAGTLDGTGHHPPCDQCPPQRAVPRDGLALDLGASDLLDQVLAVDPTPRTTEARWGAQVDVRPIHPSHLVAVEDQLRATLDDTSGLSRGQIAGYLAKYATKDTEVLAQLRPGVDLDALLAWPMTDHVRRLAVCAWLQARAFPTRSEQHRRLRRWTHQFGYGGHYLTKSRRYSTTFGALRQARRDWQLARRRQHAQHRAARRRDQVEHVTAAGHVDAGDHTDSATDPDRYALVVEWQLRGIGWRLPGDALLARTARTRAIAARDGAREQRRIEHEHRALID